MMPSKFELERYNPSKTGGTLTQHLEKLIDAGLVMRVSIPSGERSRSGPSSFFVLTNEGYELLEQHRVFLPIKKEIRQDHAEVPKPEKVKQYELAKRPKVNVEYDHPLAGGESKVVDPLDHADDYDELTWDDNAIENKTRKDDHREAIMWGK
jgi:DNA-binding HxlR family transcriptional regulator